MYTGGGSFGYNIREGHIGGDDGYVMMEMESQFVNGYQFIDNGYCLDADGNKYNSISVFDKFTGKPSECGEGCKGCFWKIPEYVGFNYFSMEDPETGELSKKCSCLFESSISQKDVEKKTTCSFDDDAFDFKQRGQGEIGAGDSTDEKRDFRTCYARQVTRFDYKGPMFQYYEIEEDAWFRITAVGAQGGNCDGGEYPLYEDSYSPRITGVAQREWHLGGYGALAQGRFFLRKGDTLRIVVGEQGEDCLCGFYYEYGYEVKTCTGAGGGGASYAQIKRKICTPIVGGEICNDFYFLLVIAGAGGGSVQMADGLHGQATEDGGGLTYRVCEGDRELCYGGKRKSFGGDNGGGGQLGPDPECPMYSQLTGDHTVSIGGGGGGGVGSKGGTHCNYNGTKIARGEDCKVDGSNVMTEGGSQISPLDELPYGGYVDRYEKNEDYEMSSGGAGGFGAGGQGGATCHGFSKELDTAFDGGKNQCCYISEFPISGYYGAVTYGAGAGGGGGYSGGAPGSTGGKNGGGSAGGKYHLEVVVNGSLCLLF